MHVLSLPPAFVLSQDQTLKLKRKSPSNRGRMDIFRSLRILDVNQSHTHHPERQTTRRTMRTTFTDHCAVQRRPPDKLSPQTYERLATKTLAKPPAYPFKQKSFQRASDTKTVFASKQFLLRDRFCFETGFTSLHEAGPCCAGEVPICGYSLALASAFFAIATFFSPAARFSGQVLTKR